MYALIDDNNTVVQIQSNEQDGFIKVHDDIVCGMVHDGGKSYAKGSFSVPVQPIDFDVELKAIRRAKENGGVDVNGSTIQTDSESRANLLGASQLGNDVDWKTDNGFVTLTSEQIQAVAVAVGQHVQKCFSAEKSVHEVHENTPLTTVEEIQNAFDEAYNS